jgi:hypothetical protein
MGHDMQRDDPAAIACRSLQSGHHIDTLPIQPKPAENAFPPMSLTQMKLQELETWLETKQPTRPKQPSPWAAK